MTILNTAVGFAGNNLVFGFSLFLGIIGGVAAVTLFILFILYAIDEQPKKAIICVLGCVFTAIIMVGSIIKNESINPERLYFVYEVDFENVESKAKALEEYVLVKKTDAGTYILREQNPSEILKLGNN